MRTCEDDFYGNHNIDGDQHSDGDGYNFQNNNSEENCNAKFYGTQLQQILARLGAPLTKVVSSFCFLVTCLLFLILCQPILTSTFYGTQSHTDMDLQMKNIHSLFDFLPSVQTEEASLFTFE